MRSERVTETAEPLLKWEGVGGWGACIVSGVWKSRGSEMVFLAFSILFTFFFFVISSHEPYMKTKICHCPKKWGGGGRGRPPSPPCSAVPGLRYEGSDQNQKCLR